jgi:hypothetical protein
LKSGNLCSGWSHSPRGDGFNGWKSNHQRLIAMATAAKITATIKAAVPMVVPEGFSIIIV